LTSLTTLCILTTLENSITFDFLPLLQTVKETTMRSTKVRTSLVSATLFAAYMAASPLGLAAGVTTNPLDPGYYVGQPLTQSVGPADESKLSSAEVAINPLHPAYGSGGRANWQGTAVTATAGVPFWSANDPLYPGYKRQ
jgi:hypothetical protein